MFAGASQALLSDSLLLSQRGNDRRSLFLGVDPRSRGCPSVPRPAAYLSCSQRAPVPDAHGSPPPGTRPDATHSEAAAQRAAPIIMNPIVIVCRVSGYGWMRRSTRNKFFWQCLRDICQPRRVSFQVLAGSFRGTRRLFFVNIFVNL